MEFIEANWLLILLVAIAAIAILWYIFHAARRTRVTGDRRDVLDEGATPAARNQALIDSAPAATGYQPSHSPSPAPAPTPVPMPAAMPAAPTALAGTGQAVEAAVVAERQAAAEHQTMGSDDLTQLKGVGPKLAAMLQGLGINSLNQIAAWDDAEIERVDSQLGRFQGRIRRDAWVEQASLLSRGDTEGYAAKFGNSA